MDNSRYQTALAASGASMCSVILGSPFDSIKVRMQTQRVPHTAWESTKYVWRTEGLRGFFRGIVPPLISVNIVKTTSVTVYEAMRANLLLNNGSSVNSSSQWKSPLVYFLSGCTAGLVTSAISCPMEMIRNQRIIYDRKVLSNSSSFVEANLLSNPSASTTTKLQRARLIPKAATTVAYFRKLYQIGIVDGIYRGYTLHLLRESIGTGIYWTIYESMHRIPFISPTGTRQGATDFGHFLAGSFTGSLAWIFVFPLDLVKNVYQKQVFALPADRMSISQCIKHIYTSKGKMNLLVFYTGMWPTMLRAFPIHGVNLLIYEWLLKFLRSS